MNELVDTMDAALERMRLSTCEGKARHHARGDAEIEIKHLRQRIRRRKGDKKGSAQLESYRCRLCGDWHVGRRHGR